MKRLGYAHLVDKFLLPAMPLPTVCVLNEGVSSRRLRERGSEVIEEFGRSYTPEDTALGHLSFALRYEGVNLQVLKLLFGRQGPLIAQQIGAALVATPGATAPRRLGFLYEWLTGDSIPLEAQAVTTRRSFVPVLDEDLQFGLTGALARKEEKYRVLNNLPGNRQFCPLVRKTPYLKRMVEKNLRAILVEKISAYDPDLLERASDYLYLKETHSSFDIEHDRPSATRAQRFAVLLRRAQDDVPMDMNRLVELQNAVMDSRDHNKVASAWRQEQNWVGTEYAGHIRRAYFVPPRPGDLPSIMDGLMSMSNAMAKGRKSEEECGIDPVVAAASVAFGFVYAHPFMDGNGRLHRYLVHEELTALGFTPRDFILPVSAVILASKKEYERVLEGFSKPLLQRTEFDPNTPDFPATGNDAVYFRYFDATNEAGFLYKALERTIETDLDQELSYLMGFDRAHKALNEIADWPGQESDLFINLVRQNGGHLSETKRRSRFPLLSTEEIERYERIVECSFNLTLSEDEVLQRDSVEGDHPSGLGLTR